MLAPRLRLLLIGGLALVLAIALAVLNWPGAKPADSPHGGTRPQRPGQASASNLEEPPPERITVLVIGTDTRPEDPGRTDTMILVTADTGTGELHLLSIPRDTWVYIDNHGWDKVNAAYAVAPEDSRPQATMQVISDLLQVPIDHYVVVHMAGFQTVVDLLGGIDIYVEKDMYYVDPKDTPPLVIDLKEGQQRLNGEDALKYVRFRSDDQGDWGRMERQQKFLKALAREAMQVRNLSQAGALAAAVVAAVDTDMTPGDLVRLGLSARKFNLDDVTNTIIGGFDRWIGGIYFLEPSLADARTLAHRQVFGKEPSAAVLEEAAVDFARAREVIESEIARFEALAELEGEENDDDPDDPDRPDGDDPDRADGAEPDDSDLNQDERDGDETGPDGNHSGSGGDDRDSDATEGSPGNGDGEATGEPGANMPPPSGDDEPGDAANRTTGEGDPAAADNGDGNEWYGG